MDIRTLIQQAYDQKLLRYPDETGPPDVLDFSNTLSLELRRTSMSGTEFGYDPTTDTIAYAWRSIDGTEIAPEDFVKELRTAVTTGGGDPTRQEKGSTMEDEEEIIYVYAEVTIGFDVAVDSEATDDEVRDAFLETFKDWIGQGYAPSVENVRVVREDKS